MTSKRSIDDRLNDLESTDEEGDGAVLQHIAEQIDEQTPVETDVR